MHDLRRQALESGKTVSRKARSKQSSAVGSKASSAANSRAASRNVSRAGSDDEEGNLSDGTAWSTNSIDDIPSDDVDTPTEVWKAELNDRMEQIVDRKRSSVQGREESLAGYVHIFTAQYAKEDIDKRISELIPAFLKSVKMETSEKETVLALRSIVLTLVTSPSDAIYDAVYQPIKRVIQDSESFPTKAAAIRALGTCAFFGGASDEEVQSVMDFFLEIIESDGHYISAPDNGDAVTAALEEWGFLATKLEDIEDITEPAMEVFVEQLESSDPNVQIAAGENIALLYEKSYTELEEDEDPPSDSSTSDDPETHSHTSGPPLVKRYTAYRQHSQLVHTLSKLSNLSARHISRKDRKTLHSNFADILNSVENPTRGPRYQNAVNHETGRRYGSRMSVRVGRTGEMRIDRWWKLCRLKALRRVLGGGFLRHWERNEVVFQTLPIMISKS